METAEVDHPLRLVAGLLLELADRRVFRPLALRIVADQAGRKLEAERLERCPELLDEKDVAVVDGKDDGGADAARARDIFPLATALRGDEPSLPDRLFRRLGVGAHNSISLSGSSLGLSLDLGRIRASTSDTFSTAAAMPSPGRPAFTCSIIASIASPHISGSTWLAIA